MDEILPGLFHWKTKHPAIGVLVDSYWLSAEGVLIDPLPPTDGGLDAFTAGDNEPETIVLSNRHHYRGTQQIRERFGCVVHVPRPGLHEFGPDRQPVSPYEPGDELPGGLVVHEIGAICPDDMALVLPKAEAVFFADAVVLGSPHGAEPIIGFVPDSMMDDPEQTKRGILASLRRLLEEVPFRHVLMAHGGPLVDDGRDLIEDLLAVGGRTAFEV